MNVGALVVIAAGVVFIIIALRGTQGAVFPGLFGNPGTSSSSPNYTPQQRTGGIAPTGGKCPSGWILFQGKCYDPGALGI